MLLNGQSFRGLEGVRDIVPKQCVAYRCQIESKTNTSGTGTLLDVPVPKCPVQRTNPPLGCRDPLLGDGFKGMGEVSMPAVSKELGILRC